MGPPSLVFTISVSKNLQPQWKAIITTKHRNGKTRVTTMSDQVSTVPVIKIINRIKHRLFWGHKGICDRGLKITYLYSTWTRLTGKTMTNRCFCYIRGEYEFTVLLLLSGAIKYIPPKQQSKTSHVECNNCY